MSYSGYPTPPHVSRFISPMWTSPVMKNAPLVLVAPSSAINFACDCGSRDHDSAIHGSPRLMICRPAP
jgi:hypothetical protein